ncbi:MAG: tetratricopeptide repeat protein, partial [Gammaproteobacteria bacterium]|nr:tetratricopeptide repeat protein [Gammaproteobacteria bacterium]
LNGLGRALAESGELQEALALHERALAIEEAARRPDHPVLALRLVPLAEVQLDLGRTDDA